MKWTEHPLPKKTEKERMLRTYLGTETLTPAKTIGPSFVHCKDNLLKDWNYSALIFRNVGGRKNGLGNHLLCSLKLSSALVSRIQICSPWIHHLLWYPGYNLFSFGASDYFYQVSALLPCLCVFNYVSLRVYPQQVSLICNWCLQKCFKASGS